MTATNHALTGALVAAAIKEPFLAVPIAFAAHFLMDAIPHFGLNEDSPQLRSAKRPFWMVLTADVILAAILLIAVPILMVSASMGLIFICMLACMAPDLVWGWRLLGEVRGNDAKPMSSFSRFHKRIQWREVPSGMAVELAWLVVALGIIIRLG